ncbi:MAG TPA: hypothetical protein DDX39_08615 [Bacteroidales bacterium]|nr:MAG: hypothetical protein A2W98_04630 [Bacteroidetes bacterium GWF2_33_38]OFY69733.1 MAG: hypothetical protein A2265_02330 [Bacteroidetes bacterium RIFOXYA12_FULL_33_9]OGC22720.1 MAG: hypothetical protein A2247_02815 [candidate division WOR-1 bacterium RIFOXYA2_FULL_41_14]HBF88690.1 hypothetical protein [Bacteroidales bacterium]
MKKFVARINTIVSNNHAGSVQLIDDLVVACEDFLHHNHENDINVINRIIIDQLLNVANKHIQLVALYKFINEILFVIENEPNSKLPILNFLTSYKEKWNESLNQIFDNITSMASLNNKTLLLHSSSTSIKYFLKRIAENNILLTIYQTVSHPAKEGIVQAKCLSEYGHKVVLIEDAGIGKIIDKIDLVLLGADAVLGDTFINKIGTSYLCHASYKSKLPVFVIADTRKYIPNTEHTSSYIKTLLNETLKSEKEIFSDDNYENISVQNYYYEEIPSKLVSVYINEEGVFTTKKINHYINSIEVTSQLFNLHH